MDAGDARGPVEGRDAVPRTEPELAVVVMSVGAPPELEHAVASLVAQGVPLEIVVVNSGGGDPFTRLGRFGDAIRIVCRERVLWPGATRNVGVAETSAPFVAFLESDCTAQPGWAANRLQRHHDGAAAVATALINGNPGNPFATASHFALFGRRLPGVPECFVHRYGASFARRLFDEYGLFREDLRTGEDTEFADRLPDGLQPVWAPEVRAAHANPTDPITMLTDQYRRGRRMAAARAALRLRVAQGRQPYVVRRLRDCTRIALLATTGGARVMAICTWPLLACCVAAYVVGLENGGGES